MAWISLLIFLAAVVAVGVAGAASRRLQRTAPGWSRWRRMSVSAMLLPALLFGLVALGIAWSYATLPSGGENGAGITSFILGLIGLVLGVPALIGGFVGAALAEPRRQA